jgi:glyoxylate/hydroxypyruvate reductase A
MSGEMLALLIPEALAQFYAPALRKLLPGVEVLIDGDACFEEADFAVAIAPPPGRLAAMAKLRCIMAPGAGVDHILADPAYPAHIPLVRMVQPDLLLRMKEYIFLHVLRHHRRMPDYEQQQRELKWQNIWPQKAAGERCVGILGLGELGAPIARELAAFGFEVAGWSRRVKRFARAKFSSTCCRLPARPGDFSMPSGWDGSPAAHRSSMPAAAPPSTKPPC